MRGYITLNAQAIRKMQLTEAMSHLTALRASHKRVSKLIVLVKFFKTIATLKRKFDIKVSQHRHQCKLERKASLIQIRFLFLRNKQYQGFEKKR